MWLGNCWGCGRLAGTNLLQQLCTVQSRRVGESAHSKTPDHLESFIVATYLPPKALKPEPVAAVHQLIDLSQDTQDPPVLDLHCLASS